MRSLLLAASLLLGTVARAAPAAAPAAPPAPAALSNDDCLGCHSDDSTGHKVDADLWKRSLHGEAVSCTDCHTGYAAGPHDGQGEPLSASDAALVARLGAGRWGEGEKATRLAAPRALLACQGCHEVEARAYFGSVHARWLTGAPAKVAGPTCVTCHGSPHAILKPLAPYSPAATARVKVPEDRRAMARTCEGCHGSEEFARAAGLDPDVKATYNDSIHGRLARVGNEYAPVCVSCHAAPKAAGGTHAIQPKDGAASPVAVQNRKETCGRCHQGATENFGRLIAHKEIQEIGGHLVPHVTHVVFSWLTTLTLVFFAFHVLVDFVYELRQRVAGRHHGVGADHARSVVRFDLHQRIQHWFMLSGVILLGITGWPLRGAGSAEAAVYSRAFLKVFGGAQGAAIWHRVGAVLIIISALYHLFYLTFLAANRRLPFSMLPVPKDALDMKDNILFMLGLRKERPRFDRFMYLEKFDYWAVFWGIVMMVGTGFVFWFPVFFAQYAPSWVITSAQIIHGEEATLAILFLFVVHFYNVHLKPSIFPMNWAWLHGRITVADLKHEHPLEYDRLKDRIE